MKITTCIIPVAYCNLLPCNHKLICQYPYASVPLLRICFFTQPLSSTCSRNPHACKLYSCKLHQYACTHTRISCLRGACTSDACANAVGP